MEKLEVIVTFHTLLSYISLAIPLFTGTIRPYVYQVDHWFTSTQDLYCLNDYHDEIPDSIKQRKDLLDLIRKSDQLFYKAVQTVPYDEVIKTILVPEIGTLPDSAQKNLVCKLYNSELLDIRIVHALAQGQKYKTIYLCAGSGHIKRIGSLLPEAGYPYINSFVEDEKRQGVDLNEGHKTLCSSSVQEHVNIMPHETPRKLSGFVIAVFCILGLLSSFLVVKFKRILLLLLVATTIGQTVLAYVTEIQVWNNDGKTLYCLSDGHHPTPLSINQTNEFIDQVCKDKESSVAIIEDILAYDGQNKEVTRALHAFKHPELHFLPNLTQKCNSSGIQACSVEFRNDHYASRCGAQITGKQVYKIADHIRSELATYNDGTAFNRCYKKYQEDLKALHEQCGIFVNQFRKTDMILADAIPASTYDDDLDEIIYRYKGYTTFSPQYKKEKILQIYDAPLIDVLILHELAQHPDKKNVFICAGGWHIDNLASSFEELGYRKVWSTRGVNSIEGKPEYPKAVEVGSAFNACFEQYTCNETAPVQTSSTPLSIFLVLLGLATIPFIVITRRKWLYFLLFICANSTMLPYVCSTSTWKNGDQTIHLYSDEHYSHPISKTQRDSFINHAKQSKSVVIVEDMKSYSGTDSTIQQYVESCHDWQHRFLLNLTSDCIDSGIPVVNVEFRQPSNASLAGYNVSAREVLCLSDELKEVLKTYNDGPEYNKWYAQVLKKLEYHQEQYEPFFKQLRGKDQPLRAILPKTKYYACLDKALQESMQYVDANVAAKKHELITMYDAALIDILLVHALVKNTDMQDVYICAGGWHIANLEDAFDLFGYSKISSQEGSIVIAGVQDDLPHAIDFAGFNDNASQSTTSDSSMLNHIALLLIGVIVTGLFIFGRYKFALILLSGLSGDSHAHIFKIDKWTTKDQSHNLFILQDFHTSRLSVNHKGNEQRAAIVSLGKEREACIIVEDIYPDAPALFKDPIHYDPNAIGPMEDKTPFKDSTTPLLALTPTCSEHGVKFDNIEFGQARYVSEMGHIITPKDCIRSADRIATEIKRYDDTETLNVYYAQQLKKYNTMRFQAQSFFDYLLTITDKTTKELFEEEAVPFSSGVDTALKTFGWNNQRISTTRATDKMIALLRYYTVPLTDAKLAHAIYSHKNNQNLIVCTGFKHIEAIQVILPLIGYTCAGSCGRDLLEDNLSEPTALDIEDSFMALDPHPILPTHDTSSEALLIIAVLFCLGFVLPLRRRKRV